jgi:hypothetical protein
VKEQRPVMLVVLALALVALLLAVRAHTDPGRPVDHRRVIGHGQIRFDGAGPERWAARARAARRQLAQARLELRRERRIVLRHPTVVEAVNLACATYGFCDTLWRKARCETGGTFDPRASNSGSGAAGLFQFLGSTWRSTPYRVFSPFDPTAAALAAGWMHAQGRGGEWACR